MACGCRLFDHGGILLCALVHGVDGRVDFLKANRLFARGFDNRGDMTVNLLHFRDDHFECPAGFTHQCHAGANVFTGCRDQCLDLFRSLCRPLGKFADFLCDDRKALAGLAGAGGLNACIQSQKIGLEGNFINNADDVGNFTG